ncbi:hypothetical protein V8C35DRAFT_53490 [Trichoderma chlorosporum]
MTHDDIRKHSPFTRGILWSGVWCMMGFLAVFPVSCFASLGYHVFLLSFSPSFCSLHLSIIVIFSFISYFVVDGVSSQLARRHWRNWRKQKGKTSLLHMKLGSVTGAMLRQF